MKNLVDPALTEWRAEHADALRAALDPLAAEDGGPLGFEELAGFLFAVACYPELVKPSEWIPLAFLDGAGTLGSPEEDQRTFELVTRLHNHINRLVLERAPSLPAGIAPRAAPSENLADDAPLSLWAQGFSYGQECLNDGWATWLQAESDADTEALEKTFGASVIVLKFFASREFAQACLREMAYPEPLGQLAARMLELLPAAMAQLATLGRGLEDVAHARQPKRRRKAKSLRKRKH
jgi:yecA family protein